MGAVMAEAREQEAVVAKLVPVKSVPGAGGHGGSAAHTPVPRVMVPGRPAAHPRGLCPACPTAPVGLDSYEHLSGHVDFSMSKVYKTLKAFKIKIGVKPIASSQLKRINEPPGCSYRQLM